jgi:hypothetical protein
MNLENLTTAQLEQELERRKQLLEVPKPVPQPDFNNLIRMCQEYIFEINSNVLELDDNWKQCIYEEVLKTIFGPCIFSWINKKL